MLAGAVNAAAGLIIVLLICSCEDMTSVFPASRNYRLSARGETFSLDEYALLQKDEAVKPFFVFPPSGDPDVTEVTVEIKDCNGDLAGSRIRYIPGSLHSTESDNTEKETDAESETLVVLENFRDFLSFSLPGELAAGAYTMTFRVFGRNQTEIYQTEQSFFYLAGEDYSITNLSVYFPAAFPASGLIPQGTTVLLEAEVETTGSFEPYIYWYNGKTRIAEGSVLDGTSRLLWTVPPQAGFQNIRAEVIPFPEAPGNEPTTVLGGSLHRGKTRELSLPISADVFGARFGLAAEPFAPRFAGKKPGKIIRHFGFAGNLADSLNTDDSAEVFTAVPASGSSAQTRWYPAGELYGLQTGPEDIYRLLLELPDENRGITAALRFSPVNDGACFDVFFAQGDAEISCALEDGFLVISSMPGEDGENNPLLVPHGRGFITLFLDFGVKNGEYVFSIRGENGNVLIDEKPFGSGLPLDNGGILQFGKPESGLTPVMVLDEIAIISFEFAGNETAPESVTQVPGKP